MSSQKLKGVLNGLKPFGYSDPWMIVACPQFLHMAESMVKQAPTLFEVANVKWGYFPDGTPDIRLDPHSIEGRDVVFLGSFQMGTMGFFSVAYAIPRYLARTFCVVYPYFHTGTMERVQREGEVATAKTLARMMSATPSPQVGETSFVIFDMHALATRFYFSDGVKAVLVTAIPLLMEYLDRVEKEEGVRPVIAFPDEGAKKRFSDKFAPKYELCLCMKTRVGDERRMVLQEGDAKGKHVFIVDDLVQSGGTLFNCKELLYRTGAAKVSVYVTHGVFPRESYKRFLLRTLRKGQNRLRDFC